MNISFADAVQILKNYATIGKSLIFSKGVKNKGTKLRTVSEGSAILAEVQVNDVFPTEFGIYDLNEFLNVISLFVNPDLDFSNDSYVKVGEGKQSVKYFYAADNMITAPPEDISGVHEAIDSAEVRFSVSENDLAAVQKAASVLKSDYICVVSDGTRTDLVATDVANDSSNAYALEVGPGNGDTFKMVFKVDNLKLLKGSYDVIISSQNISAFKNTDLDLTYYVSVEDTSTYESN